MTKRLQQEIRQEKPFRGPEHEAVLSVARTAALLEHNTAETLKAHGLTPTQYNVLRILRGAGPGGLGRNEVRDRLIAPVADATRLLDRLVDMGLVVRARGGEDRRVVRSRINARGLALLKELDGVMDALHLRQVGHLGAEKLGRLSALLAEAREAL